MWLQPGVKCRGQGWGPGRWDFLGKLELEKRHYSGDEGGEGGEMPSEGDGSLRWLSWGLVKYSPLVTEFVLINIQRHKGALENLGLPYYL